MNKLDYLDMRLEGGNLFEIFQELGRLEVEEEVKQSDSTSDVEMKATTIRLPVELLEAYDVVLKRFGLTRQDTFAYMVSDFISTSISGYVEGTVKQLLDIGVEIPDKNLHKFYYEQYETILNSMSCSKEVQERLGMISHNSMLKIIGDL